MTDYLTLIYRLTLKYQGHFGNAWWYSLVHEKNPLKSCLYHSLMTGVDRGGRLLILKSFLSAVRKYLVFLLRYFIVVRRCPDTMAENLIVTYWGFLQLPTLPSSQVIVMPQRNDWGKYSKLEEVVLLDEFISWKDFFIVLVKYFRTLAIFLRLNRDMQGYFSDLVGSYSFKGGGKGSFKQELWYSFAGGTLVEGLFYEQIFTTISRKFPKAKKIIYVYEGMAWEKALCLAFKKAKKVGVVCSAPCLTNYLYRREEAELMPSPDFLGTPGHSAFRVMKGVFGEKVFVLGVKDSRRAIIEEWMSETAPLKTVDILILLSSSEEVGKEVIDFVREGLKGVPLAVMVRRHPDCYTDYGPFPYTLAMEELELSLSTARSVVATDSTAVIEAAILGTPVVLPKLPSFAYSCPVSDGQFVTQVDSPGDFLNVVDRLMNRPPLDLEVRKQLMSYYFTFRTEEEMVERLLKV